jgi:hypothetical protein
VFSLHMSIPSELIPFLFRKWGYRINHRAKQQIKAKSNRLNTPGLPPIECNLEPLISRMTRIKAQLTTRFQSNNAFLT